jgi:hypothetical protein
MDGRTWRTPRVRTLLGCALLALAAAPPTVLAAAKPKPARLVRHTGTVFSHRGDGGRFAYSVLVPPGWKLTRPGAAQAIDNAYRLRFSKGGLHVLVDVDGFPDFFSYFSTPPDPWNAHVAALAIIKDAPSRGLTRISAHRYVVTSGKHAIVALVDAEGPLPLVFAASSEVRPSRAAVAAISDLLGVIVRSFHSRWSGPAMSQSLDPAGAALAQRSNAAAASKDSYTMRFSNLTMGDGRIDTIVSQQYQATFTSSGKLAVLISGRDL